MENIYRRVFPNLGGMATQQERSQNECRVCREPGGSEGRAVLMTPCNCRGSMKYIHKGCLQLSMHANRNPYSCGICKGRYKLLIRIKRKPIEQFFDDNRREVLLLLLATIITTFSICYAIEWTQNLDIRTMFVIRVYHWIRGRHLNDRGLELLRKSIVFYHLFNFFVVWIIFLQVLYDKWKLEFIRIDIID